ncbi:unnamed protein product [Bemisia tabaci]|uniref:BTB domain-containing protein n=1 Tax=Bemisia tabaci TaxID=7038 RepID=A0A9P0AD85_BEMTA|nr:unnamed protein product [Bemisia tabaci]
MSGSAPEPNNNVPLSNEQPPIFEREEDSDVTFLVGYDSDTWRIPGHRKVLSHVNPVFRTMFEGSLAPPGPVVTIKDVDGRAFDNLLRFLYKEEINLQSATTALLTLYAAHKYLCIDLVKKCIMYLDEHMSVDSVLRVYQHLRVYSSEDSLVKIRTDGCLYQATAPPLTPTKSGSRESIVPENAEEPPPEGDTVADTTNYFSVIDYYCSSLLFNCLLYIDQNADDVLMEESLENLSSAELQEILERDSLRVSSEFLVFNALSRWCNSECKKLHLELTRENKRKVLEDKLLFTCRYLLMTSEEFLAGPMQSDFFDKPEETLILSLIIKSNAWNIFKKPQRCPRLTTEILSKISSRRSSSSGFSFEPVPLSKRSVMLDHYRAPGDSDPAASLLAIPQGGVCDSKAKKSKSKKRKTKNKTKGPSTSCCGSSVGDCMLRVLICIFD